MSLLQPSAPEAVEMEASVTKGASVSVPMGSTGPTVRKVSQGAVPPRLLPDDRPHHSHPAWLDAVCSTSLEIIII